MSFIHWIIAALLVAGLLVYTASLQTRRLLPQIELPDGEKLPVTNLQRYARWVLLVVVILTTLAAGMVVYHGPEVWWDSDAVRLILIVALIAYLVFTLGIRALESRSDGSFDERDSAILSGSHAGVGGAMMSVMAIWMIALTESFQETHLVPSYYLYLIFWTCVMTNVIASIAGILLGYRRS
jgi:hypothetical protein